MEHQRTIAITGVTGALGGEVVRLLAGADLRLDLRLLARDPARAPAVDTDVRRCDYDDAASGVEALRGVDTLLMVSASESADRRAQHRTFVEAAAEAGVRRIVYTSFAGAAEDATFTLGRDHHDTEQAIRATSMEHTFLRDNFYLDVLPLFADDEGVVRGPAGAGRVAAVARTDVAAAAAAVLRDPGAHAGATYELTGPEALTMSEVAEHAGRVLGRSLRFEDETREEAWASRRAAYPDAPDWQLEAWVSTYTAIADGSCAQVTGAVEQLTGRPARTLEETLEETLRA